MRLGGDEFQAQLVRAVAVDPGVPAGAADDLVGAGLADDGQAGLRIDLRGLVAGRWLSVIVPPGKTSEPTLPLPT